MEGCSAKNEPHALSKRLSSWFRFKRAQECMAIWPLDFSFLVESGRIVIAPTNKFSTFWQRAQQKPRPSWGKRPAFPWSKGRVPSKPTSGDQPLGRLPRAYFQGALFALRRSLRRGERKDAEAPKLPQVGLEGAVRCFPSELPKDLAEVFVS